MATMHAVEFLRHVLMEEMGVAFDPGNLVHRGGKHHGSLAVYVHLVLVSATAAAAGVNSDSVDASSCVVKVDLEANTIQEAQHMSLLRARGVRVPGIRHVFIRDDSSLGAIVMDYVPGHHPVLHQYSEQIAAILEDTVTKTHGWCVADLGLIDGTAHNVIRSEETGELVLIDVLHMYEEGLGATGPEILRTLEDLRLLPCDDGPEGGGRCSPRTFCDERGVRMPAFSPHVVTTLPAAAGATTTEVGTAAAAATEAAGAAAVDTCARRLFM